MQPAVLHGYKSSKSLIKYMFRIPFLHPSPGEKLSRWNISTRPGVAVKRHRSFQPGSVFVYLAGFVELLLHAREGHLYSRQAAGASPAVRPGTACSPFKILYPPVGSLCSAPSTHLRHQNRTPGPEI